MSNASSRPELFGLLADCKENPRDDGVRLILADWLEENGTPVEQARAELIRSQIQYERLPIEDPMRSHHGRLMRSLQKRHGKEWLGPLAEWSWSWACLRGLCSVTFTVPILRSQNLGALAGGEEWAWVEYLNIYNAEDADMAQLARCRLLFSPTALIFGKGNLGPAGAQALAGSHWLAHMNRLELSHNRLTARGVKALLKSEYLGRLRELDLAVTEMGVQGCELLAKAPCAGQLECLTLWGNNIGDNGVAALVEPNAFTTLEILDLRGTQMSDVGAACLAVCPTCTSLKHLNLKDNRIGPEGARALAQSPYLDGLHSLALWGNPVGAVGARVLIERFGPRVHVSG
jgi:uncharacterized protein (TIGR02996 family)